jgi:hypothetical protein
MPKDGTELQDGTDQRRHKLLRLMTSFPRPVSSDELLRRLKQARVQVGDKRDPVYGTLTSQDIDLAVALSVDLSRLQERGALTKLDDGTFTVEHRVAMLG